MTAPYVERTTKLIQAEQDRLTRSLLRTELACYWARVGEFERAEEMRTSLRSEFGDGKSPRVSIMIMCLEGLLLYFRDLNPGAKDRLDRAHLLAGAIRDHGLVAYTAAWQAHVAFNRNDFDSMARAADICLSSAAERDLQALSRVTLVMGDLFAYLAMRSNSQSWYGAARDFALKIGDHATVGAITYNRAALKVFEFRLQDIQQENSTEDLDILDAEVRSAINYQSIAGLRSLDHLLSSAQIGSLILRKQFAAALQDAESVLEGQVVRTGSAQHALLLADAAMCSGQLGEVDRAKRYVAQCTSLRLQEFEIDDQALIYRQLERVAGDVNLPIAEGGRQRSAEELLQDHLAERSRLRESLKRFESIPDVVRKACAPA